MAEITERKRNLFAHAILAMLALLLVQEGMSVVSFYRVRWRGKNMRKQVWHTIAASLLSLTLFTCTACEAFAATPVDEAFVATNEFSSSAISAQVVHSTLYVLTEGKIVSYNAAQ